MPTDCPSCGGRFPVPVAELRSLQGTCPGCGTSLAAKGEWMIAEEARMGGEFELFLVGYELSEQFDLPDDVLLGSRNLEDLARAVASRLDQAGDGEARAAELVAETARRVAPLLLHEDGPAERLARLRIAYSKPNSSLNSEIKGK